MNNRTALILKLARKEHEASSSVITTVSGDAWEIVREEEVSTEKSTTQSHQENYPPILPEVPLPSPEENTNVITVTAMVHEPRVTVSNPGSSKRSPLVMPLNTNLRENSRPERIRKAKQYLNLSGSSSDSDDYDSDKDPIYTPDLDDDLKSQRKRKINAVMEKMAARRKETLNVVEKQNESDPDAIELVAEGPPENNENVEYNIHLRIADNIIVEKKKGKKRPLNQDNWSKNKSKKQWRGLYFLIQDKQRIPKERAKATMQGQLQN